MTEPVQSEEEYVAEEEDATESVEYVEEESEAELEEYQEEEGETEPEEHEEEKGDTEPIEHEEEEDVTEPEEHEEEESETEPVEHDEEESETEPGELEEKKSVLEKEGMIEPEFEEEQYVDVSSLPLRPPQPLVPPPKPARRPWHPIMWDDSIVGGLSNDQKYTNAQKAEESAAKREYPHKQRIRNLRKLIAEGKIKPDTEMVITFLCNKFAISEDRRNKLAA